MIQYVIRGVILVLLSGLGILGLEKGFCADKPLINETFAYPKGSDVSPIWEILSGEWKVENGEYIGGFGHQGIPNIALVRDREFGNCIIEVEVYFLPGTDEIQSLLGLVFGAKDAENRCTAWLYALTQEVYVDGPKGRLTQTRKLIESDIWYHLVLVAKGKTVKFYIDGTLYSNVNIEVVPSGKVGLISQTPSGKFRNFRVYSIDSDEKRIIGEPAHFDVVVAPDGTGTHTDIQEGLKALPLEGGSMLIKAGTYFLNQPIVCDKANVQILGERRNTVTLIPSSNYQTSGEVAILNFKKGNKINLKNISIDMYNTPVEWNRWGIHILSKKAEVLHCNVNYPFYGLAFYSKGMIVRAENCRITHADGGAIMFDNVIQADILRNYIEDCSEEAVVIEGKNIRIADNIFRNNTVGYCIAIYRGHNVQIERNFFEGTGISVSQSNGPPPPTPGQPEPKLLPEPSTDVLIRENTITRARYSGVRLHGVQNATVSYNTISYCNGPAIFIDPANNWKGTFLPTNIKVYRNLCLNNMQAPVSSRVDGAIFLCQVQHAEVKENFCVDTQVNKSQPYGISEGNEWVPELPGWSIETYQGGPLIKVPPAQLSDYNLIENNVFSGNKLGGMQLTGKHDIVRGNKLE